MLWFKKVSGPHDIYSKHGDIDHSNKTTKLIYFNILEPNIALLSCFKNNIIIIEKPNIFAHLIFRNLSKLFWQNANKYINGASKVLSSLKELFFFKYNSKTNYCLLLDDGLICSERHFNRPDTFQAPHIVKHLIQYLRGDSKSEITHHFYIYSESALHCFR